MTGTVATIVFVVGLIASIMVHEWGHFATARRFGMRADRFFLGFGPTLWSTRVGETEYGVKLLPLGGFVRIKGMTPDDERLPDVPSALAHRVGAGEDPVEAFADLLDQRGAPRSLSERLVQRLGRTLEVERSGEPMGTPHPGLVGGDVAAEADLTDQQGAGRSPAVGVQRDPATIALELIASEVVDSGRVGDLHHRLLKGDEGRFFHDRPAWQRAIVLGSGSALHFLQAIVIVFLGWLLVGPTVAVPVVSGFVDAQSTDGEITRSPAAEAGLQVGDRVVSVGGVTDNDFAPLQEVIQANPNRPLDVRVERDGEELAFTVTPLAYTTGAGEEIGVLGFFPAEESRPMDADDALYRTFVGPGSFTQMLSGTVGALGRVFGPEGVTGIFRQVTGEEERSVDGGISLVGAANAAGQGTEVFGALFLFSLLASVNVFVGIFNALPLPPLDGGHLAVLGVESVVNAKRRRDDRPADFSVDPRTVASIAVPVLVFVVTISLGLLWLDISNPLTLE